jgi:hypothetical protein
MTIGAYTERCPTCGAEVLTKCPSCGTRIRGYYYVRGVVGFGSEYQPPDFCDQCADPMPWLSRQGRIYQLENLLDEENLDPADELAVREQLHALAAGDLDDDEQKRRWERVKKHAPEFLQRSGAQRIFETLATAAIRSQLGL